MAKQTFVLLVATVWLLAACSKPKPPVYIGFTNLRFQQMGMKSNVVAADLKFYNPNPYSLKLKRADLDVFFNDRFVGHSAIDSLISLTANDTSFVPLQMQASAKDILANTAQLLLNPNVRVRVDGSAKAGKGSIFINIPIHYEGNQRIELLNRSATDNNASQQN